MRRRLGEAEKAGFRRPCRVEALPRQAAAKYAFRMDRHEETARLRQEVPRGLPPWLQAPGGDRPEMLEEMLPGWERAWRFFAGGKPIPLSLAGVAVGAKVSPEALWHCWLPLAYEVSRRIAGAPGRALIGISGPPGAGKSVFSALFFGLLNCLTPRLRTGILSTEGWLLSAAERERRAATAPEAAGCGRRPLYGGPETFDTADMYRRLVAFREEPGAEQLFPAYDHTRHQVIPNRLVAGTRTQALLVEGCYLFLEAGEWARLSSLWDLRIFLLTDPAVDRAGLIDRYIMSGKSRKEAREYYERVDRPNAAISCLTAQNADVVAVKDDQHNLVALKWKTEPSAR